MCLGTWLAAALCKVEQQTPLVASQFGWETRRFFTFARRTTWVCTSASIKERFGTAKSCRTERK